MCLTSFDRVADCVEQKVVGLPPWLLYPESVYMHNLSHLRLDALRSSCSKLSLGNKKQKKDTIIGLLVGHLLHSRSWIVGLSEEDTVKQFCRVDQERTVRRKHFSFDIVAFCFCVRF